MEGFPWWLSCRESAYNSGDLGLIPGLGRKELLEKVWQPTPVFLPGKFRDRGVWQASYSLWDDKSQTQFSD